MQRIIHGEWGWHEYRDVFSGFRRGRQNIGDALAQMSALFTGSVAKRVRRASSVSTAVAPESDETLTFVGYRLCIEGSVGLQSTSHVGTPSCARLRTIPNPLMSAPTMTAGTTMADPTLSNQVWCDLRGYPGHCQNWLA
jgi:hypothetical protein